jgi:nucleotide-binding universal stress UspA family protein
MEDVSSVARARRIVAGVDGSAGSRRALRRAAEEMNAPRHLARGGHGLEHARPGDRGRFDPNYGDARARADLQEIVAAELGADTPSVELQVENDLPARALLHAAEGAWLLVVGSRGLGGFKGLLLGSVSQQVAHHARCPVLIVPDPESR